MKNVLFEQLKDVARENLSWILLDPYNENGSSLYQNPLIAADSKTTFKPSIDWGPKRDPLSIVVPVTLIYVLTFLTGIVGNVSTCIVIARNKSMHTATNYYLFSLAISDLLLLISGLPTEIYSVWSRYPYIFGEAFCILQGFAAETSANATVLTITAFTVERYVAICHPFLSHTLSKLNRAVKYIIAIWMVAMALAAPQAVAFGVVCEGLSSDYCSCNIKRYLIPHTFEISTFLFFVAPMSLLTVLYVLIGLQLHRSTVRPSRGNSVKMKHRVYKAVLTTNNSVQNGEENKEDKAGSSSNASQGEDGRKNFGKNAQAAKHVVKMLVAVVVAFFICWAPFHAQRLLAVYGEPRRSEKMILVYQVLTYVSGVFYYLSTTINPLLYHIMSHKFREAFKSTFKNCFRRSPYHTPGGRCYSTLSGRSSQVNSHSNTDSYSRSQSSLRYLDAEMARLHDSRRPLVVSFRRKKPNNPNNHTPKKQVTIFDGQLPSETLASLNLADDSKSAMIPAIYRNEEYSFMRVHHLEPTHICPLNVDLDKGGLSSMRQSFNKSKSRSDTFSCVIIKKDASDVMIKSKTLPEIRITFPENPDADEATVDDGEVKEINVPFPTQGSLVLSINY